MMSKHKAFLIKNYPNGFTFEPMTIRLLEAKANLGKWDDDIIDDLKNQIITRTMDNVYLFPEQIADSNTRIEVVNTAEKWIKDFGCFSLNALRERFQFRIKNLPDDDIFGFERFLELLHEYDAYRTAWHPPLPPGKTRLTRAVGANKEIVMKKLASCIEELIDELHVPTEGQLLEKIPALDSTLLSTITKERLPFVMKTEYDGCTWYSKKETSIPVDLSEKIASCIQQIEAVDMLVTEDTLLILLSLVYQTNFMKSYHIPDNRSFRTLIEQHYDGEKRRWSRGVFSIVSAENSMNTNEIHDEQCP